MDKLLTSKYCDEAGDHYAVMRIVSSPDPRDLVFRPDLWTKTVQTLKGRT